MHITLMPRHAQWPPSPQLALFSVSQNSVAAQSSFVMHGVSSAMAEPPNKQIPLTTITIEARSIATSSRRLRRMRSKLRAALYCAP